MLGLRMSHFNEGGKDVAVDPKQKTLFNFIVTESTLGSGLGDEPLLESNTCDNSRETGFCAEEINEPPETIDFVDTYEMPESGQTDTNNHNV